MPSRRRTRFTVERPDGTRSVYLAYDLAWVIQAFPGCKVTPGDHRKAARQAAAAAREGFRVNQAALRDAIAVLELSYPVDIRTHGRVGSTNGTYRLLGRRHAIMLKSYLGAVQASETLWHELTHAQQAERVGGDPHWTKFCREQNAWSYNRRPIEIEARKQAASMRDSLLTVAA